MGQLRKAARHLQVYTVQTKHIFAAAGTVGCTRRAVTFRLAGHAVCTRWSVDGRVRASDLPARAVASRFPINRWNSQIGARGRASERARSALIASERPQAVSVVQQNAQGPAASRQARAICLRRRSDADFDDLV